MRLFAFRLAKDFHILDVDTMLSNLPAHLLYEWVAFYKYEREQPATGSMSTQTPEQMLKMLGG